MSDVHPPKETRQVESSTNKQLANLKALQAFFGEGGQRTDVPHWKEYAVTHKWRLAVHGNLTVGNVSVDAHCAATCTVVDKNVHVKIASNLCDLQVSMTITAAELNSARNEFVVPILDTKGSINAARNPIEGFMSSTGLVIVTLKKEDLVTDKDLVLRTQLPPLIDWMIFAQ
jgi:hypothetical protein